jgi:hypothetical protein
MSESSSSTPPQTAEKKMLRDLPANEFIRQESSFFGSTLMLTCRSKIGYFSSPHVLVLVEGVLFRLPKDLLCYNSTFFDRAFNGPWTQRGSSDHDVELTFATARSFELVIQWMYTSNVVLPLQQLHRPGSHQAEAQPETVIDVVYLAGEGAYFDASENSLSSDNSGIDLEASQTITSYLEFLTLADELDLLGSFDNIIEKIEAILISSELSLLQDHVRSASQLPRGHAIRKLFARACVRPYIEDINKGPADSDFRFRAEMTELESFAADLFCEYNEAIRQRELETGLYGSPYTFPDPLTGMRCRIYRAL